MTELAEKMLELADIMPDFEKRLTRRAYALDEAVDAFNAGKMSVDVLVRRWKAARVIYYEASGAPISRMNA